MPELGDFEVRVLKCFLDRPDVGLEKDRQNLPQTGLIFKSLKA
jgi:hypothetical protein